MATAPGPPPGTRMYHRVVLDKVDFIVDTRYSNLRPVKRGAYGLVASAFDSVTGQKVAIKRIHNVFHDLIDAKRILRETKLLQFLAGHDNIIDVLDIMTGPPECEQFNTLYIVTQLFECDLERIITSAQPLTDQHLQYFIFQVLRGIHYIHSASVLHRDLKPSNLLVNSNCDLAICDFGLARGISAEVSDQLTEYVVTRWYRAPELLCEAESYGTGVDVWSIGCILGEIIRRRPLFKGRSTPEQLQLIVKTLGTPTDEELAAIASPASAAIIKSFPHARRCSFSEIFPGSNPLALDLLSRMLRYHPRDRITVEEALEHPFLAALKAKAPVPVKTEKFDFGFEKGYPNEMPRELLQRHMFHSLVGVRERQRRRAAAPRRSARMLSAAVPAASGGAGGGGGAASGVPGRAHGGATVP